MWSPQSVVAVDGYGPGRPTGLLGSTVVATAPKPTQIDPPDYSNIHTNRGSLWYGHLEAQRNPDRGTPVPRRVAAGRRRGHPPRQTARRGPRVRARRPVGRSPPRRRQPTPGGRAGI